MSFTDSILAGLSLVGNGIPGVVFTGVTLGDQAGFALAGDLAVTQEQAQVDGRLITVWRSPAFLAQLRYDVSTFDGEEIEGTTGLTVLDAERWLDEQA